MEVIIKPSRRRYVILLANIILIFFLANKVYLRLFPQEPTISALYGDVEIYVEGVWIPAKAGMNIQGAKIRIKEGGILALGDKIIKAEEDTEFQIAENQVKIEKGGLAIKEEKEIIIGKNKEEESNEKKVTAEEKEEIVRGSESEPEEKTTLNREELSEEKKPEETERKERKIIDVSIENAVISEDEKYLNSRRAVIKIKTENINNIKINGIAYNSDSGNFEIILLLKEGKNHLEILGIDENKNIIDKKVEIVHVDITPPVINKNKIKIKWE